MMPSTEILRDLALELLALRDINIDPKAPSAEIMRQINEHALELPNAQQNTPREGMGNGPLIDIMTGQPLIDVMTGGPLVDVLTGEPLIDIMTGEAITDPNHPIFMNQSSEHVNDNQQIIIQALLWLAANKTTEKDRAQIEQMLADLIGEGAINVDDSYMGYDLTNLIVRAGSSTLLDLVIPIAEDYVDSEFLFGAQPDGENIKLSAIKSANPAIIQKVNMLCLVKRERPFLNSSYLDNLEQLIAKEGNAANKQALQQGVVAFKKVIEDINEKNKILEEKKAEAHFQSVILGGSASDLKIAINSLANENKLQSYLDLAIKENKPLAVFFIAERMLKLGKIDEITLINLSTKKIPHYTLQLLFLEEGINFATDLPAEALSDEALQFLIRYFPEKNQALANKLVTGDLQTLLKQDLFQDLFLHSEQTRIALMKGIVALPEDELFSLATEKNSVAFLSCALASGVSIAKISHFVIKNNYDWLSIMLIAASYPHTKFNVDNIPAILNKVEQPAILVTKAHAELAKKFKNENLDKAISSKLPSTISPPSEADIKKVNLLQGAIRMFNRSEPERVYPTFFKKAENYQFWMREKAYTRHQELQNNLPLLKLASNYMQAHSIPDHPYLPVMPPVNEISQFIMKETNYKSLTDAAYLLSATARSDRGMNNMPTMIKSDDKAFQDQELVCTAPFQVAFPTKNHFCSLTFDLAKIPQSYLQHAVIKLGDYPQRKNEPLRNVQLSPDIRLDNEFVGHSLCNYKFSYKDESGVTHTVEVPIQGADEIFHGINGFKESLCHIFYIINAIPDTTEGLLIKNKLIEHFNQLEAQGLLTDHLDSIFKQMNKYMEIDFLSGLPLNFDYLNSIEFIQDKKTFKIDDLKVLLEKGNLTDFDAFFKQYPHLKDNPFIMREMLAKAPPHQFHKVSQILEEISPLAYLSVVENQIELMNYNNKQLRQAAVNLSSQQSNHTQYDLAGLLGELKKTLSGSEFAEKRKLLMETHKEEVIKLREQLKTLYKDMEYTGNDAKMREILTNPNIIHALTGKNQDVLAAVLAFEIEAEKTETKKCDETFIRKVKSQQSGQEYDITIGSMLGAGLALPQFFTATCPANTRHHEFDEAKALRTYAKQKVFADKLLAKVELSLVDLCKSSQIAVESFQMDDDTMDYNPEQWANDEFQPLLDSMLEPVSDDSFCANPNIPGEVNDGFLALTEQLFPDVKADTWSRKAPQVFDLKEVSFDDFMKKFLSSTHILNTKISHYLFDTLHFGVALTRGDAISTIQLKDRTLSFPELINEAFKEISKTGVNPENAILAEQLALRTKMLEFWCLSHDKLSPTSSISTTP